MISLYCSFPSQTDATSFYRGVGPIAHLKQHYKFEVPGLKDHPDSLSVTSMDAVWWSSMRLADITFFQRPWSGDHLRAMRLAKDFGRPVWIDYDDDLFCLPTDNPAWKTYGQRSVQDQMVQMICLADVITVSTEAIAERIRAIYRVAKREPDLRVIPNALDMELPFIREREIQKERKKLIFWRGSPTHQRDLCRYSSEILQLATEHPDWTWHFLGMNPWWISDQFPKGRCVIGDGLEIQDYFRFLGKIQPGIMIVPLDDNLFNRGKSNIAWLEGCLAGSMVLGPEWDEWKQPGIVTYTDNDTFYARLKQMIEGFSEGVTHGEFIEAGWRHIQKNLTLGTVNDLRAQVIQDLINRRERA